MDTLVYVYNNWPKEVGIACAGLVAVGSICTAVGMAFPETTTVGKWARAIAMDIPKIISFLQSTVKKDG